MKHYFLFAICLLLSYISVDAQAKYFRLSFNDDPSTTMSVGWSGPSGTVYYGTVDNGTDYLAYANSQSVDRMERHRGLDNHFVNLKGLTPNTVYYFVIRDTSGIVSDRFSFHTISDDPNTPLSFINGGDTRLATPVFEGPCDCREDRIRGNKLLAKIRPDFIVFNGDFTLNTIGSNANREWFWWFEDWQYTIAEDGRMFPMMIATGNHEDDLSQITFGDPNFRDVFRLFNVPVKDVYYALNFGGDLLRIYALNSELHACWDKEQLEWLEEDLQNYSTETNSPFWKMANYHQPIVPNSNYDVRFDMYNCWAPLFDRYHIRLAMESHSHTMKTTYPISLDEDITYDFSNAGFSRDDECGTVYVGEGNWAAPPRGPMEFRNRTWTRQLADIRSYFFIQVFKDEVKVYSPQFDNEDMLNNTVTATDDELGTGLPAGITVFEDFFYTDETSDVLSIPNNLGDCLEFFVDTTTTDTTTSDTTVTSINNSVVKRGKIYPNPVQDKLYVELENGFEAAQILVYNALGKICNGAVAKRLSSNKYVIDANSICADVGYIMIKINGDTETHKYIKP